MKSLKAEGVMISDEHLTCASGYIPNYLRMWLFLDPISRSCHVLGYWTTTIIGAPAVAYLPTLYTAIEFCIPDEIRERVLKLGRNRSEANSSAKRLLNGNI